MMPAESLLCISLLCHVFPVIPFFMSSLHVYFSSWVLFLNLHLLERHFYSIYFLVMSVEFLIHN